MKEQETLLYLLITTTFNNMPYINRNQRLKFDEGIADILGALKNNDEIQLEELNYVISSIIWDLFEENESYDFGNNF